jgi:ABC-type multidrug transport system fused ATPase/permease subunit
MPGSSPTAEDSKARSIADAVRTKSGKLIQDESVNTDSMAWSVYKYYFGHMGGAVVMLVLVVMYICPNPFRAWADEWYGEFAADPSSKTIGTFVWVYAVLMAAHLLSTAARAVLWARTTVTTANFIHDRAVATLLRCPTRFFDTTCVLSGVYPCHPHPIPHSAFILTVYVSVCVSVSPVGRILNRISKDQGEVDMRLPFMWQFVLNMGMQILTTMGVVAYSSPWFLIALGPVAVVCTCSLTETVFACMWSHADWLIRMLYRSAAVQIQRIDSVSISPVFSMYSETLGGLDTVRAYRLHELFRFKFHVMVDHTTVAAKFLICATGWLRTRLVLLSCTLVAVCAFLIVGLR